MIPTCAYGADYAISRVAPHTISESSWNEYATRWYSMVISDEFLTIGEREELEAMRKDAVAGNGSYDAAAYLTGKGHTLKKNFTTTYSVPSEPYYTPATLDWMNTSSDSDMQVLNQCVDGLVEYDSLMNLQPKLAESWEVSEDGMTYTFHIRQDAKWYTADGTEYAPVTARDFVCGFRHMLDCRAGLEGLAGFGCAEIQGVNYYCYRGEPFEDVGCKATDDYTLVYTLDEPVPYFMSMLTYPIFLPICESFYEAQGGVYGVEAYVNRDPETYKFCLNGDLSTQVYCGPFLLQKLERSEILCVKNPGYYDADKVTLNSIKWIGDNGEDLEALYNDTLNGIYDSVTLYSFLLETAKADGNFDKYAYVTDTHPVTYFGALNLNRGTFALESGNCASSKTGQQKIDTFTAMNNKNFRKALMHAFDKKTWNTDDWGDALPDEIGLRNMLNCFDLVKLDHDFIDANGHSFPAGTLYGEMVQYYCDQLGCEINCQDGVDGWFNPTAAQNYMNAAKEQLGDTVSFPIQIDVVYYTESNRYVRQANAYKASIEDTLGAENVVVNLIEATTPEDYYASGYLAANGEALNTDMFWGVGYGADFADPCSYLNNFDYAGYGYMLTYVGLF